MNDDIPALRQQLQQLKARHERGDLNANAYAAAKAPIERKLLDQVLEAPVASAAVPAVARPSGKLVGLLSVAVLVVAGAGYSITGSPGTPSAGAQDPTAGAGSAAAGLHNNDEQQFAAAAEKLAQRLKMEPDNVEGWAVLARSYTRLGRHAEAVPAFEKAVALQGSNADLLADFADSLAVQNNRNLEGRPAELIARVLKLEPDNLKGLALAGTQAFRLKDFAGAVRHWEQLAKVAPPDSDFVQQLQESITEARTLGGMAPGQPATLAAAGPTAAPPPATASPASAGATTSTASLRGSVRLSPAVAKLASPDDTVFIFARAAEGSRMPLAILRHRVKDLPLDFTLDDSLAMSPATRLSVFPKVVVSARVSKSGQATPSAGDLTGQSAPVANDARGVVIEINEAIKN